MRSSSSVWMIRSWRPRPPGCSEMWLYVEPMDAVVVEVSADGRVRYAAAGGEAAAEKGGEWTTPTLQERRAILYAAEKESEALAELLDILDPTRSPT